MAEAIAVIGTAGTVANIIDIVVRTILAINDLRSAWKEADLTLLCLGTELGALRSALASIQDWMCTGDAALHHLLVMDLDNSVACCRLIMSKIDVEISKLKHCPDGSLSLTGKARFVFGGKKGMEELERLVQRQTSALMLLLTACNCKTKSDQKILLEKPKARKIFNRIQQDTESMVVQRDRSSISTRRTDNSSKLSMVFSFDPDLFISRVYERALRGSSKDVVRGGHTPRLDSSLGVVNIRENDRLIATSPERDYAASSANEEGTYPERRSTVRLQLSKIWLSKEEFEQKKRSEKIDQLLNEASKRSKREVVVPLMGTTDSGKEEILKQMKIASLKDSSKDELENYRTTIYEIVLSGIKAIIDGMEQFEISPEIDANEYYCEYLKYYKLISNPTRHLDREVGEAIGSLWQDPCVETLMQRREEMCLMDSTLYFLNEIHRIVAPDYLPNEIDVLWAWKKPHSGIQEVCLWPGRPSAKELLFRVIHNSDQSPGRKHWTYQFENATTVIFVGNLAGYDRGHHGKSRQNWLMESLLLFEDVVNSVWHQETSILLLLTDVDALRAKILERPFANYFPDYSGGNNVDEVCQYVLGRFDQVNHSNLMVTHLAEPKDKQIIPILQKVIVRTIMSNALRDRGIEFQ